MLKRIGLIVYAFVSFVYAQNSSRINVGVEGGLAMTCLWGNNVLGNNVNGIKYKQTLGGSAGLFTRFHALDWLSVKSGVYYDRINYGSYSAIVNNAFEEYYFANMVQLDYLSFPVWAVFQLKRKLSYSFIAGLTFGYLMDASNQNRTNITGSDFNKRTSMLNDFNRFNLCVNFGVGIDYTFKNNINLGLDIRNQLGVYNISKELIVSDKAIRTNSLQFVFKVSYVFICKGKK